MKLTRLREVRELRGWSQSKLAEESDVSRDGISNYETGHREAWPSTAKKLADALGVEISDLVARAEELVPLGEAPREAGPVKKPLRHLYDNARRGIETFCDHWERQLGTGELSRQSLEELRVGIDSFNPVIDALVAAELRDLARLHHETTGEPLVNEPLALPAALRRKLRDRATLEPAANRYIGVCLKAMRTRAQEAGADPEQDAAVINLEEFRDTLRSRAG